MTTTDDQASYDYDCLGTVECDPVEDTHGRTCEKVNDEGREDFYRDLVDLEGILEGPGRTADEMLLDILGHAGQGVTEFRDRCRRGPVSGLLARTYRRNLRVRA